MWPSQTLERMSGTQNVHVLAVHKGSVTTNILQHVNVFLTLHTNKLCVYSVLTSKNEVW